MKKIIALLLAVLTMAGLMAGCGEKAATGSDQSLQKVLDAGKPGSRPRRQLPSHGLSRRRQ